MALLDFESDNSLTGFRLRRFEIFNWGTFSNLAVFDLDGFNSLLTGNIGSGKSTVVDALTTMLVPHNKIIYNRAAGSERKERTLASYIRGEYRSEKSDAYGSSKSVYLRDEKSYSVLLANFYNKGYCESVTLCQIFYFQGGAVKKLFIVSGDEISIKDDMINFGENISSLKNSLKKYKSLVFFDSFSAYSSKFRSIFGIKSEKALDLFYHTVSLKSIGNLTDFVRDNMLEKENVEQEIYELVSNFDNLTRAHDAVEKARRQIDDLRPLMEILNKYNELYAEGLNLEQYFNAMPLFFIAERKFIIEKIISEISVKLSIVTSDFDTIEEKLSLREEERLSLIRAQQNDSNAIRLNELDYQIKRLRDLSAEKKSRFKQYSELAAKLMLNVDYDAVKFTATHAQALKLVDEYPDMIRAKRRALADLEINSAALESSLKNENEELESLKKRATQIPFKNIKIREKIAQDLNIKPEDLPFAAELMKVKTGEEKWEGTAERLLRSFGLSLLVKESLYMTVNSYINNNDLKGIVVFYKISEDEPKTTGEYPKDSLANKIEIKGDSVFFRWLKSELFQRFNYNCCDDMTDFYHHPFAVTPEGLIKSGGIKHKKDDRDSIFDRSRYILGWDNKKKILLIEQKITNIINEIKKITAEINKHEFEQRTFEESLSAAKELAKFDNFNLVNWENDAREALRFEDEQKSIRETSASLKEIEEKLNRITAELKELSGQRDEIFGEKSVLENSLSVMKNKFADLEKSAAGAAAAYADEKYEECHSYLKTLVKKSASTLDEWSDIENTIRAALTSKKDSNIKEKSTLSSKSARLMANFNNAYPEDTMSFSADIEFRGDYENFFRKLSDDDLPKFEKKFKDLLKEKTIQGIALFKQKLESFGTDICEKIENINKSLREIEYNSGTFIELEVTDVPDTIIRDFKGDLRLCLEDTAGRQDYYTEEKFLQVKKILDKFKSHEYANWVDRVTDVRNWYRFNARERWKSDNSEKEFYSDSSGKSGGQKEKLAYTILASALAYQFGLEWQTTKSRSFRFAGIDEAFSRGSDDSVRYGLELFKKLDLQLLLITPLQKIHIIENYINSLFVISNNDDGSFSRTRRITIEEHKKKRMESD